MAQQTDPAVDPNAPGSTASNAIGSAPTGAVPGIGADQPAFRSTIAGSGDTTRYPGFRSNGESTSGNIPTTPLGGVNSTPGETPASAAPVDQNRTGSPITGLNNESGKLLDQVSPLSLVGVHVGSFLSHASGGVASFFDHALGGVFCLAGGSLVQLEDESWLPVDMLSIGHQLRLGGMVTATGVSLCPSLMSYRGERMSPNHVVFDEGKGHWLQVKSMPEARPLTGVPTLVYPIVCERHVLVSPEFVSADFALIDNGEEMGERQRLMVLNEDTERRALLSEFVHAMKKLAYAA